MCVVFLVAEIGVNWDGKFDLLEKMLVKSKLSGFDAVKFQSFDYEIVKDHPESERLLKSSISPENIKEVNELCEKIEIEWFSTPMYLKAVDFLKPFVKRFKIREFDGRELIKNRITPLVKNILESEKEVIVSTEKNPKQCMEFNNQKIKWLYCVPKYPSDLSDMDFTEINDYNGYSNHCTNIIAPITAGLLGAEIIEIHVTLSKKMDFIDNNVSFTFEELNQMIKILKDGLKIKTKFNNTTQK